MNCKILIVDDEPKNLKLLKDVLEITGYTILVAGNGREAIETALLHRPDLILMDLHLPVMDGMSATKILKNNPDTSDIPVLVLSGSGPVDNIRMDKTGCDGYITKPFNLGDLRSKIQEYLNK
jgi:CheY-like chemotaxis protein